jgi:hypothetical protein
MGDVLGKHVLIPHPDTPPREVAEVSVVMTHGPEGLWLEYYVAPAATLVLPEWRKPLRADGLWKTTCFELFVQPEGSAGYLEFNFSPSFEWAAYGFTGYREGMQDYAAEDPAITVTPAQGHFWLAVEAMPALPEGPLRIGLTAVIEEADGTKSYWALAHPEGKPDFHAAESFALTL